MKYIFSLLVFCFVNLFATAQKLTFKANNNYLAPANPASIVTNGLYLYLNAMVYSGGRTWVDLSPLHNNATIGGTTLPTYSSSPASISFGYSQYATTSNNSLSFSKSAATFIAWINPSITQPDYTGIIFSRGGYGNPTSQPPATGLDLFHNNSVGYHWNDQPNNYNWNSNLFVPNNAWSMVVIAIEPNLTTAYLCNANGIRSAVNNIANVPLNNLNFFIACDPFSVNTRVFAGKIGIAMIYNTTLTKTEITSIFNAQKPFFGL